MIKAIVVHSGGMDSSICLALAIREFGKEGVLSLGFSYGQRHGIAELAAAEKICRTWGVPRVVLDMSVINQVVVDCSLVDKELPIQGGNTLVVGRNGLMAHLAAIYAHGRGISILYMGIIESYAEEAGYRDCTRLYVDKTEEVLRIDLNDPTFTIRTPLAQMTKKESLVLADELGILSFLLTEAVSCYEGVQADGCGRCLACESRREAVREFMKERSTST